MYRMYKKYRQNTAAPPNNLRIIRQYAAKMGSYIHSKEADNWENLETGPPQKRSYIRFKAIRERQNKWKKTISNSVSMMYLKSNSYHTAFILNFGRMIGFLKKNKTSIILASGSNEVY